MTDLRPRAVLGLALAPLDPLAADRSEVRGWLDRWWYAGHAAGMDQGVAGLPGLLPDAPGAELEWLDLLAGRQASDGRSAALAFRAHDVVGVLLRWEVDQFAAAGVALAALPGLDEEPPASVLGEVRVVVATAADPTAVEPAEALDALGITGPGLRFAAVIDERALLAEVETGGRRTFALVVAEDDPGYAEQLLAVTVAPAMGSLTRYLVHGAKLRYLTSVFQAEQAQVRAAGQRSDESLTALFRLHETLEGASGRLDRTFFDANSRLGRAQGDAAGLAVMATRLEDLARSTHIAARNLQAYAPAAQRTSGAGTTSFDRDTELAEWLQESVEQEVGYLASAKARAAEAHQLTQLRLEQASEEEARLSNRLTTLQTSVLGAVLGFLGVMEAFGESFDGHPRLFWPVFLTVPTLALLVPPLTLRWVSGLTALDVAAGAACGAATGWTAASIAGGHPLLGSAAAGVGAGVGGVAVALHRKRQQLVAATAAA